MKTLYSLFILSILWVMQPLNAQNYALDFDGTDDYVSIGTISGFSSLSIEALIYPESITGQTFPPIVKSVGEFAFEIDNSNSEIKLWVYKGTGWYASPAYTIPTLNTWYHVAGVYDGNTIRLYINGIEIGTATDVSGVSGSIAYSAVNVEIGRDPYNTNRLFNGKIDEVRIWNVARTLQQISDNQLIELNGNETGLVAYYDMNEGTGTTLTNRSRTTSTSYNGSINGATYVTGTDFPLMLTYIIPSANYTIGLPLYGSPMNVVVDWGDGSSAESFTTTGEKTHSYSTAGTYTVKITGTLKTFGDFNASPSPGIEALNSIVSFGNIGITSLNQFFNGATTLTAIPTKLPASVTSLSNTFLNATTFNLDISGWDVSHVTNMQATFFNASSFNQDIGDWNVSNVTILAETFKNATSFNQDIGEWNVSNVDNFQAAFEGATAFDQNLGSWDFSAASGANWRLQNMIYHVALSPANYNALLISLRNQTIPSGVNFPNSGQYTGVAAAARNYLTATKGWFITGDAFTPLTWNGSANDGLTNVSSWKEGIVPKRNDKVIVPDGMTFKVPPTDSFTCIDLTIKAGGNLIISDGASLINRDSSIWEGTIAIEAAGSASLTRTLPGGAQAWQMISGPAYADISDNGWNPVSGTDDFYTWDEAAPGTWVNYLVSTGSLNFPGLNGGGDLLQKGKGYLVAYNAANKVLNLTATSASPINSGDIGVTLKNTGSSKSWTYASGWNLLGNPYPSYIDWNLADLDQFVDDFAYWYDPNKSGGEGYVAVDGSNLNARIAPFQGFFVLAKSTAHNETFTFTNAMRTHLPSAKEGMEISEQAIRLRLSGANRYDETDLRIRTESDQDRDRLDALKMFSFNAEIPQLYSFSANSVPLAVNSIPFIDDEAPIALGMIVPMDGSYAISLENSEDFNAESILLEDRQLGVFHPLLEQPYPFEASSGKQEGRFLLHFKSLADSELNETASIRIFQQGSNLYLHSSEPLSLFEMYTMDGKLLQSNALQSATSFEIRVPSVAGVYFIRLRHETGTLTRKFYIH